MNDFYEKNHRQYFHSTVNLDPSSFLEPLCTYLKPQATILDIGCGSGRDLLWLSKRGFQATGFEQASSLACLARKHTKCPVIEGDFCRYDFSGLRFSALVLVGSLVHLPKETLPTALRSTCQALVPNGFILITLKEGNGISRTADGRVFTLWSKNEIEKVFAENHLQTLHFSRQVSKLRPDDIWLGYVLRNNNNDLMAAHN